MIHKLIQGGEQYLPFALSKERQLRGMGHLWTAQRYVVDDGSVIAVRIEGENSFIHITGGAKLLSGLVDVGVVESVAEDDGSTSYYMPRFWPRDDFRPTDTTGWLTRGALPAKLANLDLTFNGTSFRGSGVPYPDSRASEYGKRGPASLYSGTMRQVVQVLLSACKGEPKAQWTEEQDGLGMVHGFNNADIPYDYRFFKSHGVLTCSDHTQESPNVWVIEISERGVLAWRMRTTRVSSTSYPELHTTLGYKPYPTRRPIPADDDQLELRVLMAATDPAISDYFHHEGFYNDCGFAFSYSGRQASNVSIERIPVPDTDLDRTLSIWSNLWTLEFTQEAGDDGVMRPTGVTVTRTRSRLLTPFTNRSQCDLKFPSVNLYGERSLISCFMPYQYQPYLQNDGVFPVHVFYAKSESPWLNEEACVYSASTRHPVSIPSPNDGTNFSGLDSTSIRENIRLLRSGDSSAWATDNVSGYGISCDQLIQGFSGSQNDVSYGDTACLFIGSGYDYSVSYINTAESYIVEDQLYSQSFTVPFGEREAVYSYTRKVDSKIESDVKKHRLLGIARGKIWAKVNYDIWNSGVYGGNRRENILSNDVVESPTDYAGYTTGQRYYPPPSQVIHVYDPVLGWINPEPWSVVPAIPQSVYLGSFLGNGYYKVRRKLILANSSGSYEIVNRMTQTESEPTVLSNDDAEFDTQIAFIPGESMTTKLIDASSDAFTGTVYASEGINKTAKFVRFGAPSSAYPDASELSYRWCYWVGVPYYVPPV